jgi:hypothetical protein
MRDAATGRRGALRRWIIAVGLVSCAGVAVAVLCVMALVQESPTWWRALCADDPVIMETARRLENGVFSELHYVRPSDPDLDEHDPTWRSDDWTVSLRAPEASAWLTSRLPRWLTSYDEQVVWPADASQLQVAFVEDRIHVGIKVDVDGAPRVLSATLRPELDDSGAIWMRAGTVRIGRLGLPASWVLRDSKGVIAAYVPTEFQSLEETEGMFSAFRGEHPLVIDPVLKLEDGRKVRLLALAAREGRLEITCRTEK